MEEPSGAFASILKSARILKAAITFSNYLSTSTALLFVEMVRSAASRASHQLSVWLTGRSKR